MTNTVFDQDSDESDQVNADLGELEGRTEVLLNDLETKQFHVGLVGNVELLLTQAKNYAEAGSNDAEEGARLCQQFDTHLESTQGYLASLEQEADEKTTISSAKQVRKIILT